MSVNTKYPKKILLIGCLWVICIFLGFSSLIKYDLTAGTSTKISKEWPKITILEKIDKLPTLVVFIHPRCPCSVSSLHELEIIMSRCKDKLKCYVIFLKPPIFKDDWIKTRTWEIANHISGVEVIVDLNGKEIERFGSKTSGQALLYDRNGKLIFNGGITASRNHEGDNLGRNTIISYLNQGLIKTHKTPVFGCPLIRSYL